MDKFPSYEESPMDGSKPRCPPAPERPVARHSQQVSDHTLFIYIFNLKNIVYFTAKRMALLINLFRPVQMPRHFIIIPIMQININQCTQGSDTYHTQ